MAVIGIVIGIIILILGLFLFLWVYLSSIQYLIICLLRIYSEQGYSS